MHQRNLRPQRLAHHVVGTKTKIGYISIAQNEIYAMPLRTNTRHWWIESQPKKLEMERHLAPICRHWSFLADKTLSYHLLSRREGSIVLHRIFGLPWRPLLSWHQVGSFKAAYIIRWHQSGLHTQISTTKLWSVLDADWCISLFISEERLWHDTIFACCRESRGWWIENSVLHGDPSTYHDLDSRQFALQLAALLMWAFVYSGLSICNLL